MLDIAVPDCTCTIKQNMWFQGGLLREKKIAYIQHGGQVGALVQWLKLPA